VSMPPCLRRILAAPTAGLVLALWLLAGLGAGPARAGGPALLAAVTIAPQAYFVNQVAGSRVRVLVMVPPGASPHAYEPRPRQLAELSRAAVYFTVGLELERAWLPRFKSANPRLLVVHTEAKVPRVPMLARRQGHRAAGHRGLDPHIWLDPRLVIIQARAIMEGLCRVDPAGRERYRTGFQRFRKRCLDLDRRLRGLLAGLQGRRVLVYHPAWGYFCRAYGLAQVPVQREGKSPGPRQLARLIDQARRVGAKVVFVQPGFSTRGAEMVARAVGAKVVPLDPLAPDWAENLKRVARAIRKALESKGGPS